MSEQNFEQNRSSNPKSEETLVFGKVGSGKGLAFRHRYEFSSKEENKKLREAEQKAAQEEYNSNPELRDLLSRAASSEFIRKPRRMRKLTPFEETITNSGAYKTSQERYDSDPEFRKFIDEIIFPENLETAKPRDMSKLSSQKKDDDV